MQDSAFTIRQVSDVNVALDLCAAHWLDAAVAYDLLSFLAQKNSANPSAAANKVLGDRVASEQLKSKQKAGLYLPFYGLYRRRAVPLGRITAQLEKLLPQLVSPRIPLSGLWVDDNVIPVGVRSSQCAAFAQFLWENDVWNLRQLPDRKLSLCGEENAVLGIFTAFCQRIYAEVNRLKSAGKSGADELQALLVLQRRLDMSRQVHGQEVLVISAQKYHYEINASDKTAKTPDFPVPSLASKATVPALLPAYKELLAQEIELIETSEKTLTAHLTRLCNEKRIWQLTAGQIVRVAVGKLQEKAAKMAEDTVIFKAEIGSLSPHTAQIQGVWVHQDLRGFRIATRAIEQIYAQIFAVGIPTISLFVGSDNHAAKNLYKRLGMEKESQWATILI